MKKVTLLLLVFISCQLYGQVNAEGVLIYNNSDFENTVNALSQKLGTNPTEINTKELSAQWLLKKNEDIEVKINYDAINSQREREAIITLNYDLLTVTREQAYSIFKKMYDDRVKELGKEYKKMDDPGYKAYYWSTSGYTSSLELIYVDYIVGSFWQITVQERSLK